MSDQTDRTQDPENDELLRFAEQLKAAAPPLSREAMARVEQRMQAEMSRQQTGKHRRKLALFASAAASVLIAIGLGIYAYRPADLGIDMNVAIKPALVEDRITVTVGTTGVAVEKPLLRLDENQSLFTN